MKNILLFLALSMFVLDVPLYAVQKDYCIVEEKVEKADSSKSSYVKIELPSIPTAEQRKALEKQGIHLLKYISGTTYYALIEEKENLEKLSTRGSQKNFEVQEVEVKSKLGPFLSAEEIPDYALVKEGVARVIVAYFEETERSEIGSYIKKQQLQNVLPLDEFRMFYADVPLELIIDLAEQPWVRKIECIPPPAELFNIEGRTMTRSQLLSDKGIGGRGLTGKGMSVGIWDANIEAHPDFGNRLITKNFFTQESHGQHVAGTMVGSGLIDPRGRGMAPEATFYGWNFNENGGSTALEMLESARDYDVVVTQNSYGLPQKYYCNAPKKYDLNDEQLDLLVNLFPHLTHVFAAGNDQYACTGESSYASSPKRAKNIILVGAVDKLSKMSDFSSWGPMDDGRILPHVVTNGVDVYSTVYNNSYGLNTGTSMACPAVSGLATLLYERYRELHNGANPSAALIKGALLNTAEDLGSEGPDYQYGYGRADGERAVEVLEEQQYFTGSLTHGQVRNHQISVPSGATKLKIMLVWTDKEGKTTEKALINDLDLKVTASGQTYSPWILNPANPELPATKGIDRINNQEQVTVQNPGTSYNVEVKAHKVPEEAQEYVLVYSYVMPELRVIYPNGGENFQPGDNIVIRWNSNGYSGNQTVALSVDGGTSFTTLQDVPAGVHDIVFTVPEEQTDKAILRVVQSGTMDVSDKVFTIMHRPENLELTPSRCSASGWKLSWDAVAGAVKYKVLKANVAEGTYTQLGETGNLSYELPTLDTSAKNIYSVKAVTSSGILSERAYATIANSSGSVPITETNLPFKEEFAVTPSPFIEIEKGANVTASYEQMSATPSNPTAKGHLLVFYGDDATATWDATDVYSNSQNVANAKICNIDATAISGKLWMRLGLLMKESGAGNANFRVLVDEEPKANNAGETNITSTASGEYIKYYDVSDKAGTEFSINFQTAVRNQADSVQFSFIQIFEAKNDVGITAFQVPAPSESLTDGESVTIKVKNYDGQEISNIPVSLYVDGQLVAEEVISGPIEAFKTESYTFNTKANLSTPDKLYKIKATTKLDADVDVSNDSMEKETANLGDYYRIPKKDLYFSEEKAVTTDILRFTDDGAKVLNYSDGFKGSVIFKPTTSGQKVKLNFTEFNTQESYDKVTIYNGKYTTSTVLAVLSGDLTTPISFISSATDGNLLVEFTSSSSKNAAGWLAEVSETSEVSTNEGVNNIFTADAILNRNGYYTTPQTISVEIINNSGSEANNVQVQYRIDGGVWTTPETIASIGAGQALRYDFTTKADITENPKKYTIDVKVVDEDAYLDDNNISKIITNDIYCSTNSGFSSLYDQLYITKVAKDDVSNETAKNQQGSPTPQYFRDVKFSVYKDNTENKIEVTINSNAVKGDIGLWIDWNNDGDFEDSEEKVAVVPVVAGQTVYELPIALSTSVVAGDYNARLRVTTGNIDAICESDIYGKNGEVEDYGITVFEESPHPTDLAVVSTTLQSGENLTAAEAITITIVNKGIKDVASFDVAYIVNSGAEVKETVTVPLASGATMTYTFTTEADLSAGGSYEIKIYTVAADDTNTENDMLSTTVVNEVVATDGFFALNFDGKDDFVNLGTLADTKLETYTLEAWINPLSCGGYGSIGFGRLFEGKGATVFLCAEGHSFYPGNSIIISGVADGTFMSPANTVEFNKWQHVAISYDNDKAVKLYINGVEVALQTYKEITTTQEDNTTKELYIGNRPDLKRPFQGMMDEVRVWSVVREQVEIVSGMYEHQEGSSGLVAEFSLDEGYYNTKLYSGSLQGIISNATIDESPESIWVEPTKLLETIHYAEQVIDWQVDGYKRKSEVLQTADLTNMVAAFATTWPNAQAQVNSIQQVSGTTANDFMNSEATPVPFELTATVFGKDLSETYLLTLVKEANTECELQAFEIPSINFTPSPITEQMTFEVSEGTILTDLLTNFTVSDGAKVFVGDVEITSGTNLDFSNPLALKVVAANGRSTKEYSITIKRQQTLTWNIADTEKVKTYGDAAFPLTATASSGNTVFYTSNDENIIKIVQNQAQIQGTGEVTITANVLEDNSTSSASSITYTFTVNKKKLIITAEDKEVDYLVEIPELTMSFDGFVYDEDKTVLGELPTIATTAIQSSEAGAYSIALSGGNDDNYTYVLNNGILTIKSTDAQDITFDVSFAGSPEEEATVTVDGREVVTDTSGKGIIKLNPGTYTYIVIKEGRETYEGEITVVDKAETVSITMTNTLPRFTITFKTDGNGTIEGTTVQEVKQGDATTAVTAEPKFGYEFDQWNDGTRSATFSVTNVQSDATYTATFKAKTYSLQYSAGDNGIIEGQTTQTVSFGEDATEVKVVANSGYTFKQWSDGSTENPRKDVNVAANITVTVEYDKTYTVPYKQTFDAATLPEDWEVIDNAGDGCMWEFKEKSNHYSSTGLVGSDPNHAVMDAYHCDYSDGKNADLISPRFDLSKNSEVILTFNHTYKKGFSSKEKASLSYSINGGDWVEIESFAVDIDNNTVFEKTIDALAGQQSVRFKWTLRDAYYYWIVDDVEIKGSVAADAYDVIYRAGQNGYLQDANAEGIITATVAHGEQGPSVLAVAEEGYKFYQWSDGVTDNPRQDNVVKALDVMAEFGSDCAAINTLPYLEDFDDKQEAPDCWKHPKSEPGKYAWEFGIMYNYGVAYPLGTSGNNAYFNSSKTTYGQKESADLISPEFDLSAYEEVYLSFKHFHVSYAGKSKVSVSYSLDGGNSWVAIQNWNSTTENIAFFNQKIGAIAKQSSVMFRWNSTATWEFGWIIDDIELKANPSYMLYYDTDGEYDQDQNWIAYGSIEGDQIQTVDDGESSTSVKAIATSGYKFVKWSDDVTDNPRIDENVTANIKVTALFEKDGDVTSYVLTYTAGDGGTLSGTSTQEVVEGESGTAVEAVANEGYKFVQWSDGVTDNPRTDENVTADITVAAEFEEDGGSVGTTYTLPYSQPFDGDTAPADWKTVDNAGDGCAWEFKAVGGSFYNESLKGSEANHAFMDAYGCNYSSKKDADLISPVFDMSTNTNAILSFNHYYKRGFSNTEQATLSYSIDGGNTWVLIEEFTATNENPTSFEKQLNELAGESDVRLKWTLKDGYYYWIVDDVSLSEGGVSAEYTLTYTASDGGTLSGTTAQTVVEGESGTAVEAIAYTGYAFVQWSDGVTDNPRTDENVTADITVAAEFEEDGGSVGMTYTLPYSQPFDGNAAPADWEIVDNAGDGCAWEFKAVGGSFYNESLKGSEANHAFMDAYGCNYSSKKDADLISPVFNMSTNTNVTLSFNHYYKRGFSNTEQATLSYSIDGGNTWVLIEEFTATNENPTSFEKQLDELAGESDVRLKWTLKDGYYYWIVDDISLSEDSSVTEYTLTYTVGTGGTLSGTLSQTVSEGASGTSVEAIADTGYKFVKWSDGVTDNPRVDTNVTADISVAAEFGLRTYTLSYETDGNGTISGSATQTVDYGASGTSVKAVGNTGYKFVQWSDGVTDNPRTEENITEDITVTAQFALNVYILNYYADSNGTISGKTSQAVVHGESGTAVRVTANKGFHFTKWSDGVTDNPRTDENVMADIDVTAQFAIYVYGLYYSTDGNGTIRGESSQGVSFGESGKPVEAIASEGYKFVQWSDGSTDNPRTDTNVITDIRVVAEFAPSTYTLNYGTDGNGTINGEATQTVLHGEDGTSVEAIANEGYKFVEWSDGSAENPRMDVKVRGDISVTAVFMLDTYTLSYSSDENGTIRGETTQTVDYGASGTAVEAIANEGYKFVEWSDGSTENPRKDVKVRGDISVTAAFILDTYTLSYSSDENGTIRGEAIQIVSLGTSGTSIEAIANEGYKFVEWSDGNTDNPRTDANVIGDISVTAVFILDTYTLNYSSDENGTISGEAAQTVGYGASGTAVEAIANEGYHFVQWSDGITDNPRTDENVKEAVSVVAEFAIKSYEVHYTTDGNGSIDGKATQVIQHGESSTAVEAVANEGYKFMRWSDGSTENPRTDANITDDSSIEAMFALLPVLREDEVTMLMSDRKITIAVLENDEHVADYTSIEIITMPKHGTVIVHSDGTLSYKPNYRFEGTDEFTYSVCRLEDVCAEGNVKVNVQKPHDFEDIDVAQLLTPNGDGQNDKWCLEELEKRVLSGVGNFVKIFNENGHQVYHKQNYMLDGNCFEGHALDAEDYYDGQRLPDGVYYYVIEVEDGFKTKGFFYIIRAL